MAAAPQGWVARYELECHPNTWRLDNSRRSLLQVYVLLALVVYEDVMHRIVTNATKCPALLRGFILFEASVQ